MEDRRRPLVHAVAALLLLAQLANAAPAFAATAPAKPAASAGKPSGLVPRAQTMYREARYDEAIGLLMGPILRKEMAGSELVEARLVLARCYVKKGILPRAKEHFSAILAADPAFTLDRSRVDADELAVFNEVKGVPATPPPAATAGKPAVPGKDAPVAAEPAKPTLHKPETPATGEKKESWLAKNKFLAIGLLVGGGVVAGLAAGGGGGGGGGTPPPASLPDFPSVPSRP